MSDRWKYKSNPNYNPPNEECPQCAGPSRTFFVCGQTKNGEPEYTYTCEHKHTWVQREMTHTNT